MYYTAKYKLMLYSSIHGTGIEYYCIAKESTQPLYNVHKQCKEKHKIIILKYNLAALLFLLDPNQKQIIPDKDPDPEKSSWSDRIRMHTTGIGG